jgi:hypothetical protein
VPACSFAFLRLFLLRSQAMPKPDYQLKTVLPNQNARNAIFKSDSDDDDDSDSDSDSDSD